MATTISSTSNSSTTTSTTKAATTASINTQAAQQLLTSLGSGSGVDTASLVTSLVGAQFDARKAQITAKSDTLTTQISSVATLKNMMSDFTKALESLVKGGTLTTQPVSSNANVLTATALPGAALAGMTASVQVSQLAAAQTAVSASSFASSSATVGTGTLTLKLGTGNYDANGQLTDVTSPDANGDGAQDSISIDITDGSLSGIASAINAKKAGVTASVITNADGSAYLALKGTSGASQAFSITSSSTSGDLSRIDVGGSATGMSVNQTAKNAKLTVDGVAVERGTNEINDLLTGVKLSLTGTSPTAVGLTTSTPTSALTNAVKDLVDTYNQIIASVKEQTDPINGPLRADPAAKNLLRSLQGLTNKVLLPNAATGTPNTLSGIGVRTNKDGTLEVDDTALNKAMAATPEAIEAMFAQTTAAGTGINSVMQSLQLSTSSTVYGLGASTTKYRQSQAELSTQQDKIADQATRLTTRLTQQFASMNSRVSAYKSTQAFMTQQIDNWTKSTG
jgi:flagellar hook-associated protein 2